MYVVKLYEKARSDIEKLKEASGDQDEKTETESCIEWRFGRDRELGPT